MHKLLFVAIPIIISSFAEADELKLWCKGAENDGSEVSLLVHLDRTKEHLSVYWGDNLLIDDPYTTSDSSYHVLISEGDNKTVVRAFQLDRRSLKYLVIAPTGVKGWISEGYCELDKGPKI